MLKILSILSVFFMFGASSFDANANHCGGGHKEIKDSKDSSEATERQKKDGMCWNDESELYNEGSAFKLTCRDNKGVIVTIIADNYYGYCKKEVKSQISYSCNLLGGCEEEHAGGAVAFPSFDLGENFALNEKRFFI